MSALTLYASEHNGWYPRDAATPLESLRCITNEFGDAALLAGISGNREEAIRRAFAGLPIDETVSSWVYFPGFRNDDDPELAIIWERAAGVRFNGSRADGHAVGFVGGAHRQIRQANWQEFLKEQEALRKKILRSRNSDIRQPAQSLP